MEESGIAVKAYIVDAARLLVVKRAIDDNHYAGKWDLPGGRLAAGEDPFEGLRRETKEETGLDIEILLPIDVQHFARDDGRVITMIIFLCRAMTGNVVLSGEHEGYGWVGIKDRKSHPEWLARATDNLLRYGLDDAKNHPQKSL